MAETALADLRWARVEPTTNLTQGRQYFLVHIREGETLEFGGFTPRNRAADFGRRLDALTRGEEA